MNNYPEIECGGIRCDGLRLAEVAGGRVVLSVAWQDVKRIALRDGILAPHPMLQLGFGLALTALGYYPLRHLLHWLNHGGAIVTLELWAIAFAPIGVWMIYTAFRRGVYLEVETPQGTRRLVFHGRPAGDALQEFMKSVEQRCGAPIDQEPEPQRPMK